MKVLVACEYSGVVRRAFQARGHDAWSCDLLPSEDSSPHHIQGDVLELIGRPWDLVIAHPPCTYLTNSGVRWLKDNPTRFQSMLDGAAFFNAMLNALAPRVCVENPIPHCYARELIGRYTQIVQPWQFGHGETKATCLWLKNLPKLQPTNVVEGRYARVHLASPGPDRWKERSRTYEGIARAMAEQWG